MAIDISNTTRRIVYTGSAGTGPYAFEFEVLTQTDIAVYFNDTELELTTDYTVSVGVDGTGSITIVTGTNVPTTPDADDRITIIGDRTIERTTDFTTGGPLFATSLNDEFDSQTIFVQQVQEQADRALRAPNTDPTTINMTLPKNVDRANKTLAFDADGNPTIGEQVGDYRGNWSSGVEYNKRDLVKDTSNENVYICLTAHTSSGSLPIDSNADAAKWAVLVDAESVQDIADAAEASATDAEAAQTAAEAAQALAETAQTAAELAQTGAETAETNAETAQTGAETAQGLAEAAQAAAEAVFDNFDDAYLGSKASDPTLDNDGNALTDGALYFDTTNNIMKVYDLGTTTWYQLTPSVENQTNINTVAGISADVTTVAGIESDVTTVAADETDIGTVATNIANVNTTATNIANINTTVTNIANINTTATNIADVNTVAGISANVTTVAGLSSDIATVVADAADIGTVAGLSTEITALGPISDDITTVSDNVSDVVTFANTYLGAASSAPSTTTTGALYYNTVDEQLYVWDGSAWQEAAFSATGAVTSFNTRTGAITLSATDVNNALGSDAVLDSDIGSTVQGYDATIVVDADIGVTVQGYDADTAKYDDVTANFTGNLQQGGASVLIANQTITLSGDVTGSGSTSITTTVGNDSHSHTTSTLSGNVSAFTNDSGYLTGSAIGTTVQAYDADTTKNDVANTFTANQIINADLTVDSNTLYVDSTNNRVGIGTSSPTEKLDVEGNINFGLANAGRIYSTDGTRGSIQISAPNDATNRRVTYGNNYYLDSDNTYKQESTAIGGSALEMSATNADYGEFFFRQKQDPDAGGAERVAIKIASTGSVGIGTETPSYKLDVSGVTRSTSYLETVYAVTGTTPAIAATNGNIQTWTLSGNSTPTDSLNAGESITLMIDDGSAYTITWTSLVDQWIGGSAPTLATTGYSIVELWKVGTTVYGAYVGDAS
jgi:hypothetical protein